MLSHVQLFVAPWTVVHQASLFIEFFRQEQWTEFPFPTLGDLPDQGMEPMFLPSPSLAGGFFFFFFLTTVLPGKSEVHCWRLSLDLKKCYSWFVEKEMATHSSTLAWKIPWIEEPGRLQSMGSWRVGHDWATLLSFFTLMHWRRKWQPTPGFLPGGTWWAAVYGVTQGQTQLKQLSSSSSWFNLLWRLLKLPLYQQ